MVLLLGLVALGLAWLLPGHYPPWVSFEQQVFAALGAGLVGAAALFVKGERPIRVSWLAWVALACAAVPWIQRWFGQIDFLSGALMSSLYLAAFALSMVAGATLVAARRADLLDGLGNAFIFAGIACTGLALLQWQTLTWGIFVIDMPPGGRPFANLAQPNHLSTLLAISIMATLRCFEQRRLSGPVAALAVAWFGFGVVMTQSRTGWAFVFLVVVWWFVMRQRVALRLAPAAVLWGSAVFIAAVLLWGPLNEFLLIESGPLEARLRSGMRWLHWQTLWDAAWRSPWSGYGWSQVVLAQHAAVLDHAAPGEWLSHSHNLFLDLILWNGVPLGLVLSGVLVWWFVRHALACRSVDQWVLLGAVGAVFLHAMVEYPLAFAYFLLPVGLMMGALDGLDQRALASTVPRAAFAVPVAISLCMLAWVSVEYVQVQEALRQQRLVLARVGVDKVPAAPVPEVRLLDAPREFHRFWVTPVRSGMTVAELDQMHRVSHRYPVAAAMFRYAFAAAMNDRPQAAIDTLARLCKMHQKRRCDESRREWAGLQERFPTLRLIEMPAPR